MKFSFPAICIFWYRPLDDALDVYDGPASVEAPDAALQETDIVKARRNLRRNGCSPGVYNGDAYLISSTLLHAWDSFRQCPCDHKRLMVHESEPVIAQDLGLFESL